MNEDFESSKEDINPEAKIASAKSFDELEEVLDAIGPVQGSEEVYSPDSLIEKINRVRNGKIDVDFITRTHGLRNKVQELLNTETGSSQEVEGGSAVEVGPSNSEQLDQVNNDPSLHELMAIVYEALLPKAIVSPEAFSERDLQRFLDTVTTRQAFLEKVMPMIETNLDGRIKQFTHPDPGQRSYGEDHPAVERLRDQKVLFRHLSEHYTEKLASVLYKE